jgi:hypothetical protein
VWRSQQHRKKETLPMSIPAACLSCHSARRNRINLAALRIPYLSANFMNAKIKIALATRSKG